ncbi:MAG TPA: hypothetical protein VK638_28610 [Edaphobacter sp.]|nr:hypothetical protein [Edaphobacter sp.]
MAKLHELLAVESNLKGQAEKCRTDLQSTFANKRHLFQQKLVTYTPDDDKQQAETREQSDIQTTVRKEIDWLKRIQVRFIDSAFAIDMANTRAKSDIVLEGGDVLAKDVPATALLQLEKRIKESLEFVKTIPTLDPAKGFQQDHAREAGVYKAREVRKTSTQKKDKYITITPSTDKHPAQVAKETVDERVGVILEQEWSSLITPVQKANYLERGEELLRAVSKARSRANGEEIDPTVNKIGGTLLDYIFQQATA